MPECLCEYRCQQRPEGGFGSPAARVTAVSLSVKVLGIKLQSSTRSASAVTHRAFLTAHFMSDFKTQYGARQWWCVPLNPRLGR